MSKKKNDKSAVPRRETGRRQSEERAARESSAARISYIRKPFAVRSRFSIGFAAAALLMTALGIYGGVATKGQAPLTAGALGLCSMVVSLFAVWYGAIAFLERDKNYILAKIGIGMGAVLFFGWVFMIIIGFGG